MRIRPIALLPVLFVLAALAACGGGGDSGGSGAVGVGGGGSPPPPPPGSGNPPPSTQSYVHLTSDVGDVVGGGLSYSYTKANSILKVASQDGHLSVSIAGDLSWQADFQLPNTTSTLQVGTYSGLTRYPFQDPAVGGLSFAGVGQGTGCGTLAGSLTISKVVYSGTALSEFSLSFTQYCAGSSAALHGEIYWNANDPTAPPGPTTPPAGLWQPAAGATPASGNYVYLESQPGDYLGGGNTYLYTQANAVLTTSLQGLHFSIGIVGDKQWSGDFVAMAMQNSLATGYYGGLGSYPLNNPATGGLSWSGDGRSCGGPDLWFVIDGIAFSNGTLQSIDLRFEQRCAGGTGALHGKIHWDAADTTVPPGPLSPPPSGLWQPAAGTTPATGNYVYLESEPGDSVGSGGPFLYTQADAVLTMRAQGREMLLLVSGTDQWSGTFLGMDSLARLEPGYYGNLTRYPFNNPATGGLDWSGRGFGCNRLNGWFVIDSIVWSGTTLVSVDLRFEQHCEGATPALHGKIHWDSSDTTTVPGPVTPPPAGLWQPASGITPASGNYVYIESDPGDFVAMGRSYLYTQANAVLSMSQLDASTQFSVTGDENWAGGFSWMASLTRLEPGYYNGMGSLGFNNQVTGGMGWSGQGRGCNKSTGWFVVDSVTYAGSVLTAIDVRFEQHCEGATPALRGKIHWAVGDTTAPPGPVWPPPAGLWQPAAGVTPASGSFVYLESQAGDYIGLGGTYLFTPSTTPIVFNGLGPYMSVSVGTGIDNWGGEFQGMNFQTILQPGYYGGLERYPFGNPVKGSMDWSGRGSGCNVLNGWFVVDSVSYTGTTMTAIDLRFEQHCEGMTPALHGQVHWAP